jgi:pyruvate dehydrogenase E2 component (dihydrolipoamide acetyltransferase)
MTSGNLASWKKAVGDKIEAGDVIAEVETDKATVDYEAVDEGIIAKILKPEGTQDITVGTPIAVLVMDPTMVAAFKDYAPSAGAAPAPAAPKAAPAPAPASASDDQHICQDACRSIVQFQISVFLI